jgi:hypothetical protein
MSNPTPHSDHSPPLPEWLRWILESRHTFEALAFCCFLPLFGAVAIAFKLATDDPQVFRDFGVLVAVVTGFAAGVIAHLILKKLGADKPIIGGDSRMRFYVFIGFVPAILLALALSIYNHNGTISERRAQDVGRAQREERGKFERDPDIQAAAEMLNARRRQKENAATTRP